MATDTRSEMLAASQGIQRERTQEQSSGNGDQTIDAARLARALGWFSIGLGVAELVAPGVIGKISGLRNGRNMTRLFGLREIGAGLGILTQPNPGPWLWFRVAGDVMDMA